MKMMNDISIANVVTPDEMDAKDQLRGFRERFHFPKTQNGEEPIYFTGNSLGLMPKTARGYV